MPIPSSRLQGLEMCLCDRTRLVSREERGYVVTKETMSFEHGPWTTMVLKRWLLNPTGRGDT